MHAMEEALREVQCNAALRLVRTRGGTGRSDSCAASTGAARRSLSVTSRPSSSSSRWSSNRAGRKSCCFAYASSDSNCCTRCRALDSRPSNAWRAACWRKLRIRRAWLARPAASTRGGDCAAPIAAVSPAVAIASQDLRICWRGKSLSQNGYG